jgi:hypothetical protein
MPLSDDDRRKAMDAVSHRETAAQIRLLHKNEPPLSPSVHHVQPSEMETRPLTDDIRKQAMDAVSGRETTAQIRAFNDSGVTASPGFTNVENPQGPYRPLTDEIRKKAMDAVAHQETTAQIRLMENSELRPPGPTPSHKTSMIAERIAEMHKTGQSMEAIQQHMTKDNFGREHELG